MKRRRHGTIPILMALVLGVASIGRIAAEPRSAPSDTCFGATGACVDGLFLQYFNAQGGIKTFGMPIYRAATETIGDWTGTVQYFERGRLEHHTEERGTQYEFMLGRVGAEYISLSGLDLSGLPDMQGFMPQGSRLGATTVGGISVSGVFLDQYMENCLKLNFPNDGCLARWGVPLSAHPKMQVLEDEKEYLVWYFERVRFEYHPDLPAPWDKVAGLLGKAVFCLKYPGQAAVC